ncbi:MAG: biopolymer transporter ExbD [Alphaproteobacteria bacterium]|nr:MAG: biopolymer transporter ExbD [Alphaproteobacteria bacterium]
MNITPMVDVMLVLMIIFMVAAPMMTQGVQIALPKADAKPIEQEKPVEILLKKDGTVSIGSTVVDRSTLVTRLQAIQEGRDSAAILLRADKDMDYGSVMEVMAALQVAGMVDVGLVTDPVE